MKVRFDYEGLDTNLRLSEEEQREGVELRPVAVTIEIADQSYPSIGIGKVKLGPVQGTQIHCEILSLDLQSAVRYFYYHRGGKGFNVSHLVLFRYGDRATTMATGEEFCGWAGIPLTDEEKLSLRTVFPCPERPTDED